MFALFLSEGMNPFYQNISSFPTAIFTFILAVCVLYWLVAILGLVELDILDFDIPDADGALDVNQDTGFSNAEGLAGLMLRFGLNGVPVTVIVSIVSLVGWLVCYYIVYCLPAAITAGLFRYLLGLPVLVGSLYIAVKITAVVIRPLRPLFKKAQQHTQKLVLGQVAVVRTSRVDKTFGEAVLDDGGAGLILKVRSTGDQVFKRGDRVVLLEYIKAQNTYRVISVEEFSE
ncbi:MAG: DUF1449 domain-containing protein [Exilibacterium sp.]